MTKPHDDDDDVMLYFSRVAAHSAGVQRDIISFNNYNNNFNNNFIF